jgi:phosphomannomutase
MSAQIRFGTDGWRGVIAQDFTFDNVRACAQAVADYLKDAGLDGRGLVVGYDNRFASEDFAATASEVLAGNGIKAFLCSRATPTPVVSHGVVAGHRGGAIIITASHNPALWNGFKFKSELGASAPPQVTSGLEKRIAEVIAGGGIKHLPLAQAQNQGLVEMVDLAPAYLDHIARLLDVSQIRQAGLKVALDSMYGVGAGYIDSILGGGPTRIIEIHKERNPLFPGLQPEPIAPNLSGLAATIRETGSDVGLATDGDADRLGVMDEEGNFLTPLQVFALLALYLLEVRGERGPLVKTITSSTMLYRLGELFSVPVHETPIGFKYVAPAMMSLNALMGGEESGGYGFRDHVPERDGILAGIYLLDLMVSLGKKPSELVEYLYSRVGPHYYHRLDVEIPQEQHQKVIDRIAHHTPAHLVGTPVARLDTQDGFRFILDDGSWLLIRFSGTEPLARIYAESHSPEQVEKLLEAGRKLAGL